MIMMKYIKLSYFICRFYYRFHQNVYIFLFKKLDIAQLVGEISPMSDSGFAYLQIEMTAMQQPGFHTYYCRIFA